jgi:putative transposase
MSRPLRIEFPGAIYYITSRGNTRQTIFDDEDDRERFLGILGAVVKNHRWLCHAYCLMGNHYHLLIETPEGNLSRGMRQLNGIYTQACNRRHNRSGHLFQGRYKAILIEKDSYLLALCRYIVLNPVAAGISPSPEAWPWSSYASTAGLASPPELLTTNWILTQFGADLPEARERYCEFVHQGLGKPSFWEDLRGGLLLGGEDFVGRFQPLLSKMQNVEEIPRVQRLAHRPQLDQLLAAAQDGPGRALAARSAHIDWGYTLKEISLFWGIHYGTVSRMIGAYDQGI